MTADQPLQGVGILVTRPAHLAAGMCRRIEELGGRALSMPVLEIAPPADTTVTAQLGDVLSGTDLAVFVSANAVDEALRYLPDGWPAGPRVAAVGGRTAGHLRRQGIACDIRPEAGASSEALLAHPGLQSVSGLRVAIIKGEGGRILLEQTLEERGATVRALPVYQRRCAHLDGDLLVSWRDQLQVLTATSNESLDCLARMISSGACPWIAGLPVGVLSERNAAHARELGFGEPFVATQPDIDGLIGALVRRLA